MKPPRLYEALTKPIAVPLRFGNIEAAIEYVGVVISPPPSPLNTNRGAKKPKFLIRAHAPSGTEKMIKPKSTVFCSPNFETRYPERPVPIPTDAVEAETRVPLTATVIEKVS